MRHLFYCCIFLVIVFACKSETKEQPQPQEQSAQNVNDCLSGKDTINLVTTFTKDTANTPTNRFYSIVSFMTGKGLFKPIVSKAGKLEIERETGKMFPVVYDTCEMKRRITKNFVIKNIKVTVLAFAGTKKDKYTGFTPGLRLEEWKFASNTDRDSAMKIVRTAYNYPNNIVMYEKRYSQFIVDDNGIFLLETGAKFAEPYAIEYKQLIEQFIKTTKNNR